MGMRIRNNKGFTLLEVVVATGLLGALALGVMSQMQLMSKGQKLAETRMEELEVRRMILTALADKVACQNTLAGKEIGQPLTQIKSANNSVLYEVGQNYGNNTLKISSITTQDLATTFADGVRLVYLIVNFQKLKSSATNNKSVNITFRVKAPTATGTISECYADTDSIIQQSCASSGGTWSSGGCTFSQYTLKAGDTISGTLTSIGFIGPLTGNVTGNLSGNVTGAVVLATSGSFTGNVTATRFCTGNNCKFLADLAYSNLSCADSEVQIGVNVLGNTYCKSLTCPASQFFAGLDSGGASICRPYPTMPCATNSYISKFNSDGSVQCSLLPNSSNATCPEGEIIQSISATVTTCVPYSPTSTVSRLAQRSASGANFTAGVITATLNGNAATADSVPWSGITGKPTIPSGTCPTGKVIKEIKADGSIVCDYPLSVSCPPVFVGGSAAGGSKTMTASCDEGCYITSFWASGGESASCTATSVPNISVDYIDFANVGAAGDYYSQKFNISVYGGTASGCRAATSYCAAAGTAYGSAKAQSVTVQFNAASMPYTTTVGCYQNGVSLTCAHY